MVKHYNIRITGKVQGVFFRENTRELAVKHNISGFAENKSDGSVYIEAEGEEKDLKIFTDYLKEGPPMADVGDVDISEGKMKDLSGFKTG